MVRRAWQAMGSNRMLPLTRNEKDYRRFQKKSIVAKRSIAKGQAIEKEMLAFMRSKPGLSPSQMDSVIGKVAKRNIERLGNILPEDLE